MFNPFRVIEEALRRDTTTTDDTEDHPCKRPGGLECHSYNWETDNNGELYPILEGKAPYGERPKIRDGYLLLSVATESTGICEDCGHTIHGRLAPDGYVAIPIHYHLESADLLAAANTDPVEDPVTIDENDDGVILVNEEEELDTITEVNPEELPQDIAPDDPVAVGGATD